MSSCVMSKDIHEAEIMWIASIQQKVYVTELKNLKHDKQSTYRFSWEYMQIVMLEMRRFGTSKMHLSPPVA